MLYCADNNYGQLGMGYEDRFLVYSIHEGMTHSRYSVGTCGKVIVYKKPVLCGGAFVAMARLRADSDTVRLAIDFRALYGSHEV